MTSTKALAAAFVGAIALCSIAAQAGNVVKIVKEGSPPKYQETEYKAELKHYNHDDRVVGGGFAEPIDGNIGEFLVEDIKLTMKEKKFKSGCATYLWGIVEL